MPLPKPEPGLVISYSYLWHLERQMERPEGAKSRPCVIVLSAVQPRQGLTIVTVAPITHQTPPPQTPSLEIPLAVKNHLGLDSDKSWVILDEINQFAWPGFDLRPVAGSNARYHYGLLPPKLFAQIVTRMRDVWRKEKGKFVPRD